MMTKSSHCSFFFLYSGSSLLFLSKFGFVLRNNRNSNTNLESVSVCLRSVRIVVVRLLDRVNAPLAELELAREELPDVELAEVELAEMEVAELKLAGVEADVSLRVGELCPWPC